MSSDELPGLDLDRLRAYLDAQRPELLPPVPLTARVLPGGRSNLTYLITAGPSTWVLRRPPLGHVLPTAHDMSREYRVISALSAHSTVPVPPPVELCADPSVLGAPFYVMGHVLGTPYRHAAELAELGAARTRALAFTMVDTLADLHAVDPDTAHLSDFGRPDGFLARQLRRWKRQLDASRSRDLPSADELHAKLARSLPDSGAPSIVHGDYRLDNLLIATDLDDRVAAVLDWEMSTLGDPLTDLALLLAYDRNAEVNPGIGTDVCRAEGYPGPAEIIERYARRSGRDVSDLDWYLGFALFKVAVILEGIYFRFQQGHTVGEGFDEIGGAVEPLLKLGNDSYPA